MPVLDGLTVTKSVFEHGFKFGHRYTDSEMVYDEKIC